MFWKVVKEGCFSENLPMLEGVATESSFTLGVFKAVADLSLTYALGLSLNL